MEYGRIVGESTRVGGGRGGGGDVTDQIMDAFSDVLDQVVSLPPEILIGATAVVFVAILLLRR